jgi:hypothetical protein
VDHCVSSPRWSLKVEVGEDRSVCSTDSEFLFQGRLTESDNQFADCSNRPLDSVLWKYAQRMMVFEGTAFAEGSVGVRPHSA